MAWIMVVVPKKHGCENRSIMYGPYAEKEKINSIREEYRSLDAENDYYLFETFVSKILDFIPRGNDV